ncbi:MAG: hypothetical protein J5532_05875, partial [Lachnospiraceae bacterium]|nr:hypothetical protein [Lachnospiraceae bacterium]
MRGRVRIHVDGDTCRRWPETIDFSAGIWDIGFIKEDIEEHSLAKARESFGNQQKKKRRSTVMSSGFDDDRQHA